MSAATDYKIPTTASIHTDMNRGFCVVSAVVRKTFARFIFLEIYRIDQKDIRRMSKLYFNRDMTSAISIRYLSHINFSFLIYSVHHKTCSETCT